MTLDDRLRDSHPRYGGGRQSTFAEMARGVSSVFVLSVLVLIGVVPIEVIATFGPLSLSRVVAAGCIGLLALSMLMGERLRPPTYVSVVVLAFLTWICLSYFWSYAPTQSLLYASRLIQLGLLLVIVWQVVDTERRLRMALVALACGGLAGSLYSVADRVSAHGGVARYSVGDPNDFGVALSITLMATFYLMASSGRRRTQFLFAVIAVLELVALVRTASRTAVLATALGTVFLIPPKSFRRPRVLASLGGVIVALVILALQFSALPALARITSVFSAVETGDFNNRGPKWTLAFEYWSQAPLGGLGAGAFRVRSAGLSDGTVAHSVWLGLLSELGIVGFFLFATIIGMSLINLLHHLQSGPARAVLAMEVCWLVGSLTLTLETRKITWLLVALATSGGVVACSRPKYCDPTLPPARGESER